MNAGNTFFWIRWDPACLQCRPGQDHRGACTVPTVKHGGVNVLRRGCRSVDVEEMTFTDGTKNGSLFTRTQNEQMTASLLARKEFFQNGNDLNTLKNSQ